MDRHVARNVLDKYHLNTAQFQLNLQSNAPDHVKLAKDFDRFLIAQRHDADRELNYVPHNPTLYDRVTSVLFHKNETKETGIKFA